MRNFLLCEELWGFCRTSPSLRVCGFVHGREPMDERSLGVLRRCLSSFAQNSNGFAKELQFTEIIIEDGYENSLVWTDIAEVIRSFDALDTLNLCACPLALLKWMLEGLLLNPSIKNVEVSPCRDWTNEVELSLLFERFIQSSVSLQCVTVRQMTTLGLQCLTRPFTESRSLTTLKMSASFQGFGHGRVRRNDEFLGALSLLVESSPSLQELTLWNLSVSPTGYRMFCQAVKASEVLKKLYIHFGGSLTMVRETSNYLTELIGGRNRSLLYLELCDYTETAFAPASFRHVLAQSNSLKALRLCVKSMEDAHFSNLLGGLRHNESLKELHFSPNLLGNLTGEQLNNVFDTNTTLETLNISRAGPELIGILTRALTNEKCGLQCLSLYDFTWMTPHVMDNMLVASHQRRLKELHLVGTISQQHIKIISRHLPRLEYLVKFSIRLPPSIKTKRRLKLIEAMMKNQSLESFEFDTSADAATVAIRDMCVLRNTILRMKRQCIPDNLWPRALQRAAHSNRSGLFLALRMIAIDFCPTKTLNKRKAPSTS